MTITLFVQYILCGVYVAIFLRVLADVIRQPRRTTITIAVFFGLPCGVILITVLTAVGALVYGPTLSAINRALILTSCYMLLRLVSDCAEVSPRLLGTAAVLVVMLSVSSFVWLSPRPIWLVVGQSSFFVGLKLYAAQAFWWAARRGGGVTGRRMQVAAVGSACLALATITFSIQAYVPALRLITLLLVFITAVFYFLAFATPNVVRRVWQEPELRAFLGRAARLPRLANVQRMVQELERGATDSLGALAARVGLWNEQTQTLHMVGPMLQTATPLPTTSLLGDTPTLRVFREQRPLFAPNDSRSATNDGETRAEAVLAAPITVGTRRLGVLTVYAERAPIFAADDLALVQLLADQAAVLLESRALIDEVARVEAQEKAARLKDDFLIAAAHDLRTPLTTLMGRVQLMERRVLRDPESPADLATIQIVLKEARRLKQLVSNLLDAARADSDPLVGQRELLDLVAVVNDVCIERPSSRHPYTIDSAESVVGEFDRERIVQVLDNVLNNALKYTPEGGEVILKVWQDQEWNHLSVLDNGIGIPAADLPHVFKRFYRGENVNDVQFSGLGLGLYICRTIVEQHGGIISATPNTPQGTAIHVRFPRVVVPQESA